MKLLENVKHVTCDTGNKPKHLKHSSPPHSQHLNVLFEFPWLRLSSDRVTQTAGCLKPIIPLVACPQPHSRTQTRAWGVPGAASSTSWHRGANPSKKMRTQCAGCAVFRLRLADLSSIRDEYPMSLPSWILRPISFPPSAMGCVTHCGGTDGEGSFELVRKGRA